MGGCCGEGIPSCERVFDRRTADADLRDLRRKGPPWATSALVDALADGLELDGLTVVDIGAGVGAVHLALLERGARRAVDVDGSTAYVAAAREEAERRGLADRVSHVVGDVTVVGPGIEPADLVALDRAVCCYGDAEGLMRVAATLARRRIGFVLPRDTWWLRAGVTIANPVLFRGSAGYRMHVHPAARVADPLRAAGFRPLSARDGRVWRVEAWERAGP
jgi:magnesium-protoporphyrin O-methyltransferase